jgi:hypothetical protein
MGDHTGACTPIKPSAMSRFRLLFPLLLLACAGCCRAQTVTAAAPLNWTTWADVEVTWTHPSPLTSDWVGAFLPAWNATYIQASACTYLVWAVTPCRRCSGGL